VGLWVSLVVAVSLLVLGSTDSSPCSFLVFLFFAFLYFLYILSICLGAPTLFIKLS
jgi:hypothetical protein